MPEDPRLNYKDLVFLYEGNKLENLWDDWVKVPGVIFIYIR